MAKAEVKQKGFFDKAMDFIEKIGNAMPDPVSLFIILAVVVVILSAVLGSIGYGAVHPGTGKTIQLVNLLTKDGFRDMYSKAVANYSNFAPLGMVMVCIIGAAVAEKSGFLVTMMKQVMGDAKSWMVTFAILFVAINANLAGDAGYIVMPPLAAVIYMGMGRSPVLGMIVAYAGCAGGFSANIMLGMTDALAYGFTESAARMIDPNYQATMAINWYFLIVSCILLAVFGTLLTEKFLVKRFPTTKEDLLKYNFDESEGQITEAQKRGLKWAVIGLVIFVIALVAACIGDDPLLADPKTHSVMTNGSPFMNGIILTVTVALFVVGACYGFGCGKYKNDRDLFADITLAFKDMAGYIFMCFFIAQFTSYFAWSNLGYVMAIKGAIFVPMLMLMGFDPAVTQVSYRIGDSITNPLSPLFPYCPVILGFVRRYAPEMGLGSVIANMVPFSVTFTVIWIIQLLVWIFLDIPLGPGGGIFLN